MNLGTVSINVVETPEGMFRASCPQMPGLSADGSTYTEAEHALFTLLESRVDDRGPLPNHAAVILDPDVIDFDEREPF